LVSAGDAGAEVEQVDVGPGVEPVDDVGAGVDEGLAVAAPGERLRAEVLLEDLGAGAVDLGGPQSGAGLQVVAGPDEAAVVGRERRRGAARLVVGDANAFAYTFGLDGSELRAVALAAVLAPLQYRRCSVLPNTSWLGRRNGMCPP
jgi:hypothetical protein